MPAGTDRAQRVRRSRPAGGNGSPFEGCGPCCVASHSIYSISEGDATPVSAGAVWLDEEVETREEGIERLQDLIVANVDAARPAIRRLLGLPPLERAPLPEGAER